MSRRAGVWGGVAAACYLAAAALTARVLPVRPLFDGLAPPAPYQWVNPPPDFRGGNHPPQSTTQTLPLSASGTTEVSVATPDGQATLILPDAAFTRRSPADTGVRVQVTPKDPSGFGPPPAGLTYAGNAYEIGAAYEPSGDAAEPALDTTVLMTYATTATEIAQRRGAAWTALATTDVAASLQVFAKTRTLGVFVPVGHGTTPQNSLRWWTLGIASGLAALLGLGFGLRERRRLARQ
jgi:hypothetical protein